MIKDNPAIQKLLSLKLPVGDYAVMGGAVMFAHGLKSIDNDIDIIARNRAWEIAQTYGKIEQPISKVGNKISLFNGEIEIFDDWAPGVWNINKLINSADLIEGIPFVKLRYVLESKRISNREKDQKHIKLIESHFKSKQL